MCRIAAYLGPELSLADFLWTPEHSLYRQSWAARELRSATVNADGFGLAWLAGDGDAALYRNPAPIWADTNLPSLARSLASRAWVGNVRSATPGLDVNPLNTQPFIDGATLYTHNGFIRDFARTLRRRARDRLDGDLEADVHGNTDSEYLFALLRQQRRETGTGWDEVLTGVLRELTGWIEAARTHALLNVIVTDGERLYASRHAVGAECPTLYTHAGHPALAGGCVIASEAFDGDPGWRPVPPHHLLTLAPGRSEASVRPL